MKIESAVFEKSSNNVLSCPTIPYPEFAFIGRSNVGKSSLLNMITGNKNLAKTSQTPGKTQLINHFRINNNFFIVDLPGYGYAKVSKSNKAQFEAMITNYLLNRKTLQCTFILIDSRLPLQQIDLDFINWCGENNLPFVLLFSKTDKLKKNELQKNILSIEKKLLLYWEFMPHYFITSSVDKTGKKELLSYLEELNKIYFTSKK